MPEESTKCSFIVPSSQIHVCRDPDDDKFLDCAVDGDCVFITTGDKDLLSLEEYEGIKIVTAAEFLQDWNKQHHG